MIIPPLIIKSRNKQKENLRKLLTNVSMKFDRNKESSIIKIDDLTTN
jgi:hypothetical protein